MWTRLHILGDSPWNNRKKLKLKETSKNLRRKNKWDTGKHPSRTLKLRWMWWEEKRGSEARDKLVTRKMQKSKFESF